MKHKQEYSSSQTVFCIDKLLTNNTMETLQSNSESLNILRASINQVLRPKTKDEQDIPMSLFKLTYCTKHRIKTLWPLLLRDGWFTWHKEWIWTEDLLLGSHISWLTSDFWKSGTSQNPLANKPCSSWMKWDGILKAFHMGLPSRPSQSFCFCL